MLLKHAVAMISAYRCMEWTEWRSCDV